MCEYCTFEPTLGGVSVGKRPLIATDVLTAELTKNILEFKPKRLISGYFLYVCADLCAFEDLDDDIFEDYTPVEHCPACGRLLGELDK